MSRQVRRKLYDTDSCMKLLYESLVRDFRAVEGVEYKFRDVAALRHSIKSFRDMPIPDCSQASPQLFKKEVQLANLFKRYRFKTDVYTDQELEELTFQKYIDNQTRLCRQQWQPIKLSTSRVLQHARRYLKKILTDKALARFADRCRFSTRATQGNPARDAYIDHKLADPITGHPEHIEWFRNHLAGNEYLSRVLEKCSPTGEPVFDLCTSLTLVQVPKSYKSYRPIMPNTLIGSYHSYGLGQILEEILREEVGLDIEKLQFLHRKYAKLASIHRGWVTADLSAASESFLWWLIARLIPRKWLRELNRGRCRAFRHNGKLYHYASFMAMGIGFTFPLQTLLFYAIVNSCRELLGSEGFVSVYGDDLIYPRKIHDVVKSVFDDIGFVLNDDKTHVSTHFRESCGGDYFRGVDVRPFQPEGQHQLLGPKRYEAFLYQTVNGLLARWHPAEIPITVRAIKLELLRVTRLIKQVPGSFPDYSGWRVDEPDNDYLSGMMPVRCRFKDGTREFVVPHLKSVPRKRYVSQEDAYLYDWFRTKEVGELEQESDILCEFQYIPLGEWKALHTLFRYNTLIRKETYRRGRDSLELVKLPKQPRNYRSRTGKRLARCIAVTPCKLEPQQITSETVSISDWTKIPS